MPTIDLSAVRDQFPALSLKDSGRAPVFFDGPGGTQVPRRVIDAVSHYLACTNANHGGPFRTSRESDAVLAAAHEAMADFLNARSAREIVMGPNMTTLTFQFSRSMAQELNAGDEIIITRLDHDANRAPWQALAEKGVILREVDFDPSDCTWSAEALARQVTSRTKVVAVGLASNSTGTINPVAEAARIARQAGALCFVDAVHYAPHGPIDVNAIGCDFLACSAYKFFGPHTGILWGRYELLDRLPAYKVRPAADTPPHKWETGTQGFEGIAGLRGALAYLEWLGRTFSAGKGASRRAALRDAMKGIQEYESVLCGALADGLQSVKGVCIKGVVGASRMKNRVPTFSFTLDGHHPKKICQALDGAGIFAWDGNYYAPEVTRRLGLEESGGMVRVGAVHYNTPAEIQRLVDVLGAIAKAGE